MKKIKLEENTPVLVQTPTHEFSLLYSRQDGWEYLKVEIVRRLEPGERRRPEVIRLRGFSAWLELPSGNRKRISLKEMHIFYHSLFM